VEMDLGMDLVLEGMEFGLVLEMEFFLELEMEFCLDMGMGLGLLLSKFSLNNL